MSKGRGWGLENPEALRRARDAEIGTMHRGHRSLVLNPQSWDSGLRGGAPTAGAALSEGTTSGWF